ncbi:663_t:CDS:1, partial [Gigaspora margarita]
SAGGHNYSEAMKLQLFIQELRPNLALAIGLFKPNILQDTIKRAK